MQMKTVKFSKLGVEEKQIAHFRDYLAEYTKKVYKKFQIHEFAFNEEKIRVHGMDTIL